MFCYQLQYINAQMSLVGSVIRFIFALALFVFVQYELSHAVTVLVCLYIDIFDIYPHLYGCLYRGMIIM